MGSKDNYTPVPPNMAGWKIHHLKKMYFLFKMGIFQPAMFVLLYWRVYRPPIPRTINTTPQVGWIALGTNLQAKKRCFRLSGEGVGGDLPCTWSLENLHVRAEIRCGCTSCTSQ